MNVKCFADPITDGFLHSGKEKHIWVLMIGIIPDLDQNHEHRTDLVNVTGSLQLISLMTWKTDKILIDFLALSR